MSVAGKVIDGKAFSDKLIERVASDSIEFERETGLRPGLAVVLVGKDPASSVYVATKIKRSEAAGIRSQSYELDESASETELLQLISKLNADPKIHGILVQLPLPCHINESTVTAAISPQKDVDGFHPSNVGMLSQGRAKLVPCTPLGCLLLLKEYVGDLAGKKAVIVGRSNIVGKPMASLLLNENCTVTILHSRSRDLQQECAQADILIVAIGRPNFIGADAIKPGAVVIDVGINRIEVQSGRRLVGDVDYDSASSVASAITPVPGGVGPMTVACLMMNTLIAAKSA